MAGLRQLLYVNDFPADVNDSFLTLALGHIAMTIAHPIWIWYGRDALEGGWTVRVVVTPGFGPRFV